VAKEFSLTDRQRTALERLLPTNQPGAGRADDRPLISGIVHVLRSGCRWADTPKCYGPPTTIYNRNHRWSQRGIRQAMLPSLALATSGGAQLIDTMTAKAHRSAAGGKGRPMPRPSDANVAAAEPRRTSKRTGWGGRSPGC
jgi:transposase